MPSKLRVGVAGAGVFGGYHAQKYAAIPECTLDAIFDIEIARAEALAAKYRARAYDDYDAFINAVGALSIATPASTHFDYGRRAAQAGRHAYIEKPMTTDHQQAQILVDEFQTRRLVLGVGHQERQLLDGLGLLQGENIEAMEFSRCGPASGRCSDVSVVYDLMIHDLDFAYQMGFKAAESLNVCGDENETTATIVFGEGIASFIASRNCVEPKRFLKLSSKTRLVEVDFLQKTMTINGIASSYGDQNNTQIFDPLLANIKEFVVAASDPAMNLIDQTSVLGALKLATKIEHAREKNSNPKASCAQVSA